jgi:two-component system chemotaxis response regulator CheY
MSGDVLVVDDESIVREFFKDVARSLGGHVDTAEDGDVAVQKYRQRHYDIVFMDMRMPNMNGLEACRSILDIDPSAKVVIMSGYAEDRMMDQAMECGAVCKISKPFDLNSILNLIASVIPSPRGGGGADGPFFLLLAL